MVCPLFSNTDYGGLFRSWFLILILIRLLLIEGLRL